MRGEVKMDSRTAHLTTRRACLPLRLLTALLALALAGAFAAPARADHDSVVTLGVGAGAGILRSVQPGQQHSATTFVNQASLRLKLLGVLGVDYSYDLGHEAGPTDGSEVQFAAKMRLTAIAYLIPTPRVSLYVGGGVGGTSIGELVSVKGDGNSYHVGAGLEVHLSSHFSVDTSFYMVIPGVRSVERHVERLALSAAEAQAAAPGPTPPLDFDEPSLGDFVSPKNYELMIRLFLFL